MVVYRTNIGGKGSVVMSMGSIHVDVLGVSVLVLVFMLVNH